MILSIAVIVLAGFVAGQLLRRLSLPPLLGMILAGIAIGPVGFNAIDATVLAAAPDIRAIAVTIILMKAGLGLDRRKLAQQGSVALRLGFLPALSEAICVAIAAHFILGFDWQTGLLLGCILGAESPAVIVPGMLRLKQLGWGVAKGIPDAILSGSAVSDVVVLTLFSVLLSVISGGDLSASQIPVIIARQIGFGLALGYGVARLLVLGQRLSPFSLSLVTATVALVLVGLAAVWPWFSGYLAVMTAGFVLADLAPIAGRILRQSFGVLWSVAEIFLFVLLGSAIAIEPLARNFVPGLLILGVGTIVGRGLGWYLATLGSNWTWRERLFLLPGNSPKATVQAAIGAVPLSVGLAGGDAILAIAALSILITAPLGAWAIPVCAPKLLQKGAVNPTQVERLTRPHLVAIGASHSVLTYVAAQARLSNAQVTIVSETAPEAALLADIDYRVQAHDLSLERIQQWQPDTVVISRQHPFVAVLTQTSAIAVTLV